MKIKMIVTMVAALIGAVAIASSGFEPPQRDLRTAAHPADRSVQQQTMRSEAVGTVRSQSPRSGSAQGLFTGGRQLKSRSRAASDFPEIYGCVIYADGWTTQANAMGMYQIPTSDDMEFRQLSATHIDASSGGVLVGDTYWTCYSVDYFGSPFPFVIAYDAETWEEKYFEYGEIPVISTGVVYDKATDKIYGCFRNDTNNGYVFGTVDYESISRTKICDLSRMWSAVSITRDGQIYAIDELGILYKVDKTNGDMTMVGDTGLRASHPSSACIDPRSGRMFYALTANNADGSLYEVDLQTAESTLVYHFPKNEEVVGLYIPMPDAEDGAPDSVRDVKIEFPNGSLDGEVSFTMPDVTFDGKAGEGEVSYVVEANGDVVAHGVSAWGAGVKAPVSMAHAGEYEFKVYASNGVGNGPASEVKLYVGMDVPRTPDVTMTRDGDEVVLSWTAVTESVNGGFVDVDNMRYDVVRMPDGKVVAEATASTEVRDRLPAGGDLTSYYYTVTATYGDVASAGFTTGLIWTGSVAPGWEVVFDNELSSGGFTVINANGDANVWTWSADDNAYKTTFNRAVDCDDWLVTPAIRLEAGKVYEFVSSMRSYNGNPEYFEMYWGKSADLDGLTNELLPRTQVKSRKAINYTGYISPDETGEYHVAIRCVTPAQDSWYLYVDRMGINAGVKNDIPAEPENLTLTPDYDGARSVEVSFVAPSRSVSGGALASLDRVEIRRGESLVKVIDNPRPGETLTYTDAVPASDYYTYDVVAYNECGRGKMAQAKAFVGVNTPGKSAWAKVTEGATPGEVTVSWAAVDYAEDGSRLNPALVRYDVVTVDDTHGGEPYNAASGVSGTEVTFMAAGADKTQTFVYYAVKATTETGYSLMTLTPYAPVGPSYAMPYKESFSGGKASSLMRPESTGTAMWSIYTDNAGIPANDGDGGMAAMFSDLAGTSARLYSGKISLKDATSPVLTLYAFNITGSDPDMNELNIYLSDGGEFVPARTVVMSELGKSDGWYPVMIPLGEYKGKEVQFCLEGVTRNRQYTLVDNISIAEAAGKDLKVGLVTAPSSVTPDGEFVIETGVENIGSDVAASYTVTLLVNGKEMAMQNGESLAAGSTEIFSFSMKFNASMPEDNSVRVRVDFADDANPDNNESAEIPVRLIFEPLPRPQSLSGTATASGTRLSWTEPDMSSAAPDPVVEDFEGFDSWSKTGMGGWTFVDADNTGIGSIQNVALPGIDYGSKLSWFVMDASYPGLDDAYSAHSGSKYLSTMFCLPPGDFTYVANDDWLISPALYGGEQTISFQARSANYYEVPESFEVLYSTVDSTDPKDFVSLADEAEVAATWTEYGFKLPEGARRFAIRYNKTYGIMLHVDDVKYIPAGTGELKLAGYNVYRDNELLNDAPVAATEFVDSHVCAADTRYAVSAVYEGRGESKACDEIVLNLNSGLDDVAGGSVRIVGETGRIRIVGARGERVAVYNAQGHQLAGCTAEDETVVRMDSGIYIVRVGRLAAKVVVR